MKKLLFPIAIMALAACSSSVDGGSVASSSLTKEQAEALSPIGVVCERVVQTPISRGRGDGLEGKYTEEVIYSAGYLRGDVDQDGDIDRDDAMLATKKFYKPENFDCPAAADVGGYPQTYQPDGFFTSQDIYVFHEFRKTGVITWNEEIICSESCAIVNHMKP